MNNSRIRSEMFEKRSIKSDALFASVFNNKKNLSEILEWYDELVIRGVKIEEQKLALYNMLVKIRYSQKYRHTYGNISDSDSEIRVEQLHKQFAKIERNFNVFDLKIFLKIVFLLHNSKFGSVQKTIPWKEIEFLISLFIFMSTNTNDMEYKYYTFIYKKNDLINYLKVFMVALSSTEEDNKNKNSFKGLIKQYYRLKNFYNLNRILSQLKHIDEPVTENHHIYKIQRILQIIGESMKSSDQSPNLSKSIARKISNVCPRSLIEMITVLRNSFSHCAKIRKILTAEDTNFYEKIRNDLMKIVTPINQLIFEEKQRFFRICVGNILKCPDDDIEDIDKIQNGLQQLSFEAKNIEVLQMFSEDAKRQWNEIREAFPNPTDEQNVMIKYIEPIFNKSNTGFILNGIHKLLRIFINDNIALIRKNIRQYFHDTRKEVLGKKWEDYVNFLNICLLKLVELTENQEVVHQIYTLRMQLQASFSLNDINILKSKFTQITQHAVKQKVQSIMEYFEEKFNNNENLRKEFFMKIDEKKKIFYGKVKLINFIKSNPDSSEMSVAKQLEMIAFDHGIEYKKIIKTYLNGDYVRAIKNIENIQSDYGKFIKEIKSCLENPLSFTVQNTAIHNLLISLKISNHKDQVIGLLTQTLTIICFTLKNNLNCLYLIQN